MKANPATLVSSLLVVGAGVSVALQQILNVNLRAQLGSPWWAGFVSYFVGVMAMLVVAVLAPGPRISFASLGSNSNSNSNACSVCLNILRACFDWPPRDA